MPSLGRRVEVWTVFKGQPMWITRWVWRWRPIPRWSEDRPQSRLDLESNVRHRAPAGRLTGREQGVTRCRSGSGSGLGSVLVSVLVSMSAPDSECERQYHHP